jgi:FtsH-binding integral membrane protein
MIISGFILIFFPSYLGTIIYSGIGALLFSAYLIFDTQMIIGGKRDRYMEFSVDDYVPAAISLYIDIVQLFIYMLQIFGDRDRR